MVSALACPPKMAELYWQDVVRKVEQDSLPKLSFSRHERLSKQADFQSIFDRSTKATGFYFTILYQANSKAHGRLGIVVSKKHVLHAVTRNAIKRIVRESFRLTKESLKGLDLLVLVRTKCSPLNKKALRDDIDRLWPVNICKKV